MPFSLKMFNTLLAIPECVEIPSPTKDNLMYPSI